MKSAITQCFWFCDSSRTNSWTIPCILDLHEVIHLLNQQVQLWGKKLKQIHRQKKVEVGLFSGKPRARVSLYCPEHFIWRFEIKWIDYWIYLDENVSHASMVHQSLQCLFRRTKEKQPCYFCNTLFKVVFISVRSLEK